MDEFYNPLKKKYKLPNYDIFENEFDIIIENPNIILKEIAKKIVEKYEYYLQILEQVLQPEQSISDMYEFKAFDETDKIQIVNLLRSMRYYTREFDEIYLLEEEQRYADFINASYKDWKQFKKELVVIMIKLKQSWKTESSSKTELGYFG